jgi:hypothetical protein
MISAGHVIFCFLALEGQRYDGYVYRILGRSELRDFPRSDLFLLCFPTRSEYNESIIWRRSLSVCVISMPLCFVRVYRKKLSSNFSLLHA